MLADDRADVMRSAVPISRMSMDRWNCPWADVRTARSRATCSASVSSVTFGVVGMARRPVGAECVGSPALPLTVMNLPTRSARMVPSVIPVTSRACERVISTRISNSARTCDAVCRTVAHDEAKVPLSLCRIASCGVENERFASVFAPFDDGDPRGAPADSGYYRYNICRQRRCRHRWQAAPQLAAKQGDAATVPARTSGEFGVGENVTSLTSLPRTQDRTR